MTNHSGGVSYGNRFFLWIKGGFVNIKNVQSGTSSGLYIFTPSIIKKLIKLERKKWVGGYKDKFFHIFTFIIELITIKITYSNISDSIYLFCLTMNSETELKSMYKSY